MHEAKKSTMLATHLDVHDLITAVTQLDNKIEIGFQEFHKRINNIEQHLDNIEFTLNRIESKLLLIINITHTIVQIRY